MYLDTIGGETARLERLVEDLLDMSKLDRGTMNLQLEFLRVSQIISETIQAHTPRVDESGISLQYEGPKELPVIYADRDRVRQVLSNLLDNAVNFSNEGDVVTVRAEVIHGTEQDNVKLSVSDDGMGISPKDLPFVFNRFFRAENAKIEGIPGTGLGLSIVKEIVTLHGGHVEVHSAPGEGTTFGVYLPMTGPVISAESND